ncbi:MAG: hypothetical protein H0T76_22275 [Nannocystis sp.]|nr:hypothetical protein [Nannocystis sp.]MBA3549209.1 hypothetical protein [Nannocystis sp.]
MDLSALLAREGIQADDADVLVAWARQRAAALVARIDPDSELAQQLGLILEHARSRPSADGSGDVPMPVGRQGSRSGPRPINRTVSRPHLGAVVQAALSRNEPALERALETADLEIPTEQGSPPAATPPPAPTPTPVEVAVEPEPEVEDASIGGFNRFAFSVRRRVIETSPAEPAVDSHRPTLTRGFELHSEASASGRWEVSDLDLPAPPGFEARVARDLPIGLPPDAEASGLLVVGIPDDEGIDIPVARARPRSESRKIAAPVTNPEEPQAARSSDVLEFDSGALDLEGLDLDIPEPPARETTRPHSLARPNPSPFRSPPPPPPARSAPQPGASGPLTSASQSGPLASAPQTSSAPQPAAAQLASKSSVRRGKTPTAEQKQVKAPEPKPAAKKAGKGRKKVVELGQPVTASHEAVPAPAPAPTQTKHSIGNHLPTSEPSSPGHQVPAYLQDDDE